MTFEKRRSMLSLMRTRKRLVRAARPRRLGGLQRSLLGRVARLRPVRGGQPRRTGTAAETLLLLALHPRTLTAAAALDSATDMAAHYRAFPTTPASVTYGRSPAPRSATPTRDPQAYAQRSPIDHVRQLAASQV